MATTISGLSQVINAQDGDVQWTVKLIFYTQGKPDTIVEVKSTDDGVTVEGNTMTYVLNTKDMLPGQLAAFAHVTYPLYNEDGESAGEPITEKVDVKLDTIYTLSAPPVLSSEERDTPSSQSVDDDDND